MAKSAWPPAKGLCTPTVARQDVILQCFSSVVVNAPASVVWDVLRDTAQYGQWNSFVPEVKISSQPGGVNSKILQVGTSMIFQVVMDPKKPTSYTQTQLRVVDISTPDEPSAYIPEAELADATYTSDLKSVYRISWKVEGGFMTRGLRSERFHEIIILDNDKCEVRSWETMGGVLARAVKWAYSTVLPLRFQEWGDGLKEKSEKLFLDSGP